MKIDYKEINKKSWNKRTEVHFDSKFYDNESFIAGRNALNSIELELLGDISGKSVLHLQCHFGQDTISLERLGAGRVVGVDLSDLAILKARELANVCNSNAEFIESDVYELPQVLSERFDLVFTSYGTIGWLPSTQRWAEVIAHFLKPGGQLVFAEFHPVVWMFDDDFNQVKYNYFNEDAFTEIEEGSYTDGSENLHEEYVYWNHGLAEVFNALKSNGLTTTHFQEYDYSPYSCFKGVKERKPGEWVIEKWADKLPLVYALKAVREE
jgi:SAM-dependent methyltransferase